MKSKKFMGIIAGVILASSVLAACGQDKATSKEDGDTQSDGKEIVLRLADNQPVDFPTVIGDKKFAELVNERTDGRIKIEVFPSGQLGDEKSVLEQVQLGAIEFTRVSSSPLAEFNKEFTLFSVPYLFENHDHMWSFLESETGTSLLNGLQNAKMQGLAYYDSGSRSFYSSKPLTNIDDIKGLKIRVQQSEMNIKMLDALGASATPMPFGEVFSALQTGVIDGAENNLPSYESTNHYEEAKHMILDHHTRVPEVLLMSKSAWDKLSEKDQEIIKQAAIDSVATQRQAWDDYEEKSLKKITDAGVTLTEVKDLTPWKKAVQPVIDQFGKEYPELIKAIDATRQ